MHEATLCPHPAMCNQIHFQVAGTNLFFPVSKSADRNHLTHAVCRMGFLLTPSTGLFPDRMKLTIYRGGAHSKELGPHSLFQLQMPVPLMASTSSGNSAFNRLPQMRSDASQSTINASLTAS